MSYLEDLADEAANFENAEGRRRYVTQQATRALQMANNQSVMGTKIKPRIPSVTIGDIQSKAQFSLQIVRDSNTINQTLPVPLFGVVALEEEYATFLAGQIPAGLTLDIELGNGAANPLIAKFTYTETATGKINIISVSCANVGYAALIRATMTDVIQVNRMRYSISDVTKLGQLGQNLTLIKQTLFGKLDRNNLTPSTYRSPQNLNSGLVDIDVNAYIDKDSAIIVNIGAYAVNFGVTIDFFVNHFSRRNAASTIA